MNARERESRVRLPHVLFHSLAFAHRGRTLSAGMTIDNQDLGREQLKLACIEACRGLAAIAVVLYHVARHIDKVSGAPSLTEFFRFGHAGVDLFFVISGFIILFVHYEDIGRPCRLKHYLERRFTRIFPIYWIALSLTLLMSVVGGHASPGLTDFVWSSLLIPSQHEPLLGVAWTLQYEIVFYAVFALLIFNRAAGVLVMLGWFSIVGVSYILAWKGSATAHLLLGSYNLEFFAGLTAGWWFKRHRVPLSSFVFASGLALFGSSAVLEDMGWMNGYADIARLAYGIPAMLIVAGAAETSRSGRVALPGILCLCGNASYSIYLFQFVFIGFLWKTLAVTGLDRTMAPALLFAILSFGAVGGGILVFRSVEHPLMRYLRDAAPIMLRIRTASNIEKPI